MVWEVGSLAILGFGGLGWVWEAICSDSWVWRRSGEEVWGGQGGGSGRPYVAIPGFGGRLRSWVWGGRMQRFLGLEEVWGAGSGATKKATASATKQGARSSPSSCIERR